MNATRRSVVMAVLATPIASCATGGSGIVPSGAFQSGPISVTLRRDWSDLTFMEANHPPNVRMLSVDGPLLNRLYVASLEAGQSLVKPRDNDTPRPVYRTDMTDTELVEFVVDCVAQQYQAPESQALRPQNFGATPGVRFDIATRTSDGLNMSGTALVARANNRLNILLYLAPTEHYYAAMLPDVEAVFASARLS